jgi:hypothetical protein
MPLLVQPLAHMSIDEVSEPRQNPAMQRGDASSAA